MYEASPIEIVAPAPRRRFNSSQEALAYYNVMGVKTHEDLIVLAELIHEEFAKIHKIFDAVFAELEADADRESQE